MKKISKKLVAVIGVVSFILGFTISIPTFAAGPATLDLGTSANFVILAKTSITTTGATSITGDIGISPAAASVLAGFSQVMHASGKYSTSAYVSEKIYAADYASPTPTYVGTAVSDMQAAYVDGAGRTPGVGATNLDVGGGTLTGNNFVPGTYTWGSNVTITGDITLTGTASDIWIFQIAGTLGLEDNQSIILAGGASADNIFWVVAGTTTLKPGSTFEGNILGGPGASTIAMQSGSTLNGRALGQTDVTLIANTIGGGITVVDPQLTVTKVVTNNNGGTSVVANFPLFIDGGSVTSEAANTVSVGLHTVSETYDSALYTQTFSSNCPDGDISLGSGDDEVCTITNNDRAPSLTLNKIVINDDDGDLNESDWTLTATGPSTISGPGASGSTDVVSPSTFEIGTYILSETSSADYTASAWSCVGATLTSDSITLGLGDTVTCTITNDDIASTEEDEDTPSSGGSSSGGTHFGCKDPNATNYEYFAASKPELCIYSSTVTTQGTVTTIAPVSVASAAIVPSFPNTGFAPVRINFLIRLWYR